MEGMSLLGNWLAVSTEHYGGRGDWRGERRDAVSLWLAGVWMWSGSAWGSSVSYSGDVGKV